MRLNKQINSQLNAFQSEYDAINKNTELTDEEYNQAIAKLQTDYNLNLDNNQISKGIGDPMSLYDSESVKKRMLLNAKRDRKYARQEKWANAAGDIISEAGKQFGNILNAFTDESPNARAARELSERQAMNQPEMQNVFNQTAQMYAGLQDNLNGLSLKKTTPGEGVPSGPSQFAKQGMKIEYMSLFK